MDYGIAMFVTDESIGPHDLGRLVEQHGFESLFVPEHTHILVERTMPHPLGNLREELKRTLDPLVALTAAAMATTRLRVGTGILLVPQHDPIVLAKAAPPSTSSATAACCSASAPAGTSTRCATTARTPRRASHRCASACWRCARSGPRTSPSSTASTSTSTGSGRGRSPCSSRTGARPGARHDVHERGRPRRVHRTRAGRRLAHGHLIEPCGKDDAERALEQIAGACG